ncbi:MAG: hypothetical protein Q9188_003347 [Gyalolechia gomerana]
MTLPSTPSGTPAIKRSLSDIGSDEDILCTVPSSCRRFASKIIDVYIGDERYHYAAHEAFLFKSEELKNQYDAANRAKKKTNKNPTVLNLPRETPVEFGQLLEYLYLGQLTLYASEPQGQADELLSIWVMGSKHSLIDMQKQVIRKLEEHDIAGKLPALAFLRLADNLYESEVDNGLRRYFAKVAVDVVRKIKATDMPTLLTIMSEGGSFASDLFHAYHQASGLQGSSEADQSNTSDTVKYEGRPHQHNGHAKRARTDDASSFMFSATATSASPDVRTKWDEENNIPEAWETASTEDKLLVTKAEDGLSWTTIADSWEKATGTRMSINDLVQRCDRIKANILRLDKRDADLLIAARTTIEGKFNTEKWPLIAAHIVKHGGNKYEPIRLKRYCDAIDAAARAKSAAENADSALIVRNTGPHRHAHDHRNPNVNNNQNQNVELPTEVVGGVRVENSKPLNPRRRRRVAIKAPTARQARNKNTAGSGGGNKHKKGTAARNAVDISSDEDTEMNLGGLSRESTTLFVDAEEAPDLGPVDTGVRVRNEGKKRGPGGMRFDPEDVVVERGVNAIEGVKGGDSENGNGVVEEVEDEVVRMQGEDVH